MKNINFITYIVNLKKHKRRKASIIKELKYQGLKNYKIIPAVNGYALSKKELDKKLYKNFFRKQKWNPKLQLGQVGCALSHLKIYRLFLKSKFKVAFILEDDAIFKKKLKSGLLNFIVNHFSNKSQITLISEIKEFYKKPIARFGSFKLIKVTNAFFTHSYFINKQAAQEILKFNYPVKTVADNFVYFKIYCKIKLFGVDPYIVTQDNKNFNSSIGYKKIKNGRRGFLFKFRLYKIKNTLKKFFLSCFDSHL